MSQKGLAHDHGILIFTKAWHDVREKMLEF